jgi:hypothetical protein
MTRKLETSLVSISCPELRRAGLFVEGKSKLLRWSSGTSVMVRGGMTCLEFDGVVIPLSYTPANLGGWRPWMLCAGCDTMRGRLFLDAGKWVCRICADIRYATEGAPMKRPRIHTQIARIDERVTWARRPWQARALLAKRARLEAKLKAMK